MAEPFTMTLTVVSRGSRSCSRCPSSSTRLYAFVLPAFKPRPSSGSSRPLLALGPLLFLCGVVFGYSSCCRPRSGSCRLQRRPVTTSSSRPATTTGSSSCPCGSPGVLFQIPLAVVALTRPGVVTVQQLRAQPRLRDRGHRGRARCCCPTTDPVSMLIAMAPLVVSVRAEYPVRLRLDLVTLRRERGPRWSRTDAWRAPPMLFDLRGRGRRRTVQRIYLISPSSWAAGSSCSASAASDVGAACSTRSV